MPRSTVPLRQRGWFYDASSANAGAASVTSNIGIDVLDRGAVGDGAADDSATIKALDDLAASKGQALVFRAGTYRFGASQTLLSPVIAFPGAKFTVIDSKTLTFANYVEAGWHQIFDENSAIHLMRGEVKADWFGAMPDNTDCSQHVRAAVKAMRAGGSLVFGAMQGPGPADPYKFSDVVVDKTCCIRGFGKLSTAVRTSALDAPMFRVTDHNVTFRDIMMEYQGGNTSDEGVCVKIDGALNSMRFYNVWFAGGAYANIKSVNGAGEIDISHCTFDGAYFAAVWLEAAYQTRIIGNYFGGNPLRSLLVNKTSAGGRGAHLTVTGNVFMPNTQIPVGIYGTDGFVISGNTFRGIRDSATPDAWWYLDIDDVTGGVIDGNSSSPSSVVDVKHAIKFGSKVTAGDVIIGHNNWAPTSDGEIFAPSFLDGNGTEVYDQSTVFSHGRQPNKGTYVKGTLVINKARSSSSDPFAWLCTKSGTEGFAPAETLSGVAGSRSLTADAIATLKSGMRVQIDGEPNVSRIRKINTVNNEVIVTPPLVNDISGASVTLDLPVWQALYCT